MAVEESMEGRSDPGGIDAGPEEAKAVREMRRRGGRVIIPQLRRDVDAELAHIRATTEILERDRIGAAGYLALLLAIAVNVWGFVTFENRYLLMWMVASLYFYGFYWMLPLITGAMAGMVKRKEPAGDRPSKPEPKQLISDVKEANLLRFRNRLIAVGWNVWFLGAVSMTAGYLFIFSIDILYAVLLGFVYRGLALFTVAVVIVQATAIMLYYLAIFFLRPYSSEFFAWLTALIQGRKERKAQGRSSVGRPRCWPACRSCWWCC